MAARPVPRERIDREKVSTSHAKHIALHNTYSVLNINVVKYQSYMLQCMFVLDIACETTQYLINTVVVMMKCSM